MFYSLYLNLSDVIPFSSNLQSILRGLEERGHKLELQDSFSSVIVGVHRSEDGRIYANSDFRKAGAVDGF